MIRYLTLDEVLHLHQMLIKQSGGTGGVRDLGLLESSIAQPMMTFDGLDLYPSLIEKVSALAFSLINNHPFTDGNKRIGHTAMESMLIFNGYEIDATLDEQERVILQLASGIMRRDDFTSWLAHHLRSLN